MSTNTLTQQKNPKTYSRSRPNTKAVKYTKSFAFA